VVAAEFVLLFPLFFAMIMGMVWVGVTFFRYIDVEQAAREGARYGATLPTGHPDDEDDSGNPTTAWFAAIADRAAGASSGRSTVCVAYTGPLGNQTADESGTTTSQRYLRPPGGVGSVGPGVCFDDGRSATLRRVQVEVEGLTPFNGFGFVEGTLRGSATARFEAVYPPSDD
jgi:hypothetical protein